MSFRLVNAKFEDALQCAVEFAQTTDIHSMPIEKIVRKIRSIEYAIPEGEVISFTFGQACMIAKMLKIVAAKSQGSKGQ